MGRKEIASFERSLERVQSAQWGRGMNTTRHGPGIKTYTIVDYSQVNGDSKEPEEFNLTNIWIQLLWYPSLEICMYNKFDVGISIPENK